MGKYWAYASIIAVIAVVYLLYRVFKRRDRVRTVALSDWVAERQHVHADPPPAAPLQLDPEPDRHEPIDETAPAVLGPAEWRTPR